MVSVSPRKGRAGWSLEGISLPWPTGEVSIYDHVRAHLVPGRPGLSEGGESLPDEARLAAQGGLRWVAGALDGTFAQHGGAGSDEEVAERLHEALAALGERATSKALGDLYDLMLRHSALESVDALNGRIVRGGIDPARLHAVARFLVTRAPDREPVKMAIAWLGLLRGGQDDDELLRSLARHEEFTLYAAVALANRLDDPESTLFSLAREVRGWGRIHLVERLADSETPEVRRWLLREGFRNTVSLEYTALIAARTGRLREELERGHPDPEVVVAAGEILSALIRARQGAGGIDDYEEGAEAIARYLDLLAEGAERLEDLNHAAAIRELLVEEDEEAWADREIHGWTPELRARLIARCDEILAWPAWRERIAQIAAGEAERDRAELAAADEAARALGVDLWDAHFRRAEKELEPWHWQRIGETRDPARRRRVLELAEARFDLPRIGSGPALDFGFGWAWKDASCLEMTLPALHDSPGAGVALLLAALRSPAIRLRHRALDVVAAWGQEALPEPVALGLLHAAAEEPDAEVRTRIEELLADPEPAN